MVHYVPRKGEFITLSFDPQAGHEQNGRRPALVLSNDLFNRHTGLVIVCPITSTDRRFPFHLPVPQSSSLTGFVMVEQVKVGGSRHTPPTAHLTGTGRVPRRGSRPDRDLPQVGWYEHKPIVPRVENKRSSFPRLRALCQLVEATDSLSR